MNYLLVQFQGFVACVIEIGARYGESSKLILNNLKVNKYLGIEYHETTL